MDKWGPSTNALDSILARLETAAERCATGALGGDALTPSVLDDGVRRLSDRYTLRRDEALREHDAPGDRGIRAARLGYFLVADAPKLAVPLRELQWAGRLPTAPRLLDVGCGVGAMGLGAAAYYESQGLAPPRAVNLLDQDGWALERATELHRATFDLPASGQRVDLARAPLPQGPYDLILFGLVLNELSTRDQRLALLDSALARLAPGGALVVVEPALRECSRELQRCRDQLTAGRRALVVGPCTHEQPCPLLARERDWCHEQRPWTPPPRLAERIRRVGLRRGELLFSYLTLQHPREAAQGPLPWRQRPPTLRVVSGTLASKGKVERLLCGEAGLLRATLLHRHRTEHNEVFGALERGELVQLSEPTERVGVETRVMRWSSPTGG